jgi:hypothetical protein
MRGKAASNSQATICSWRTHCTSGKDASWVLNSKFMQVLLDTGGLRATKLSSSGSTREEKQPAS